MLNKCWKIAWRLIVGASLVAALTALIRFTKLDAHIATIPMIYLLAVTFSALLLGRAASLLTAFLSFLSFDWYFVPPMYTLRVDDPSEWVALGVYLVTATVIGQLTARLRQRAIQAEELQRKEAALAEVKAKASALIEADRLKTTLLSMVSHDFRSPLTSIKASISTLLGTGDPIDSDTEQSLYQTIDSETDRLNQLVGNVLDLSRLEANAWKPHKEWVPCAEIIGMALSNFSDSQNDRIKVFISPGLEEVFVDSTQISQVLKNLVENALKYSGNLTALEIRMRAGNDVVVVEVLDEGRGLPENAEDVFLPFWRAAELHEGAIPGLGVGLAVCRGLAEAHGGSLTAATREPRGSSFTLILPAGQDINDNKNSGD